MAPFFPLVEQLLKKYLGFRSKGLITLIGKEVKLVTKATFAFILQNIPEQETTTFLNTF
ncbi:hypothetical protein E5S67_06306 [Microcoleus sp. IPMA8]|uniref:Transposase n=1 Tax=Microcoleus asticus IPMA8 TaxID=2563858 RepID=A0ABX2D7T7_9CYAN|nr:hypothetical protein [Microcoleus asticus IPMA8]